MFTSRFEGKSLVTTCLLEMQEIKVAEYAEKCGGMVKSAVSGKTDYLIVSDTDLKQTNKYARAQELIREGKPIQIIGYAAFLKMAAEDMTLLKQSGEPEQGSDGSGNNSRPEDFVVQSGILKEYSGNADIVVIPKGVKYIGAGVFAMKRMRELKVPEGVKEIRKDAFKNCRQLKRVTLPQSLTSISSFAFAGCKELEQIKLPENLTQLGEAVFMDCRALQNMRIPDGVTEIKRDAFRDCGTSEKGHGALKEMILPAHLKSVKKHAFPSAIRRLVLNGEDPTIERYAFTGKITELVVGEGIKTIPGYTFNECGVIHSVTFLSKETKIGSSAFDWRVFPKLIQKLLPTQLNTTLRREFASAAANIINDGKAPTEEYRKLWIESIESQKRSLEDTLEAKPALRDLMLREGFVSAKCARALLEKTQDNELKIQLMEYIGRLGAEKAEVEDELNLDKGPTLAEMRKIYKISIVDDTAVINGYKGNDTEVVIPAMAGNYEVKGIGRRVFYGLDNIKKVVIPDGVTWIGDKVFTYCSKLIEVIFPDSMTRIGNETFSWTSALSGVILPEKLSRIGEKAFWRSGIRTLVLPENVMFIENEAFCECWSLTVVMIRGTETNIGSNAFSWCSSLTDVHIPGGLRNISRDAFSGCKCTIHAPAGSYAEQYAKEHNIPFVAE